MISVLSLQRTTKLIKIIKKSAHKSESLLNLIKSIYWLRNEWIRLNIFPISILRKKTDQQTLKSHVAKPAMDQQQQKQQFLRQRCYVTSPEQK